MFADRRTRTAAKRVGGRSLARRLRKGKLVVVEEEAERVRLIFRRHLEVSGINELAPDLRARNVCTTARTFSTGKIRGGIPFGRGALSYLLRNRFAARSPCLRHSRPQLCADNGHLQEREFCRRRPARRKRLRDGSCPRRRKGARKKQREMAVKAAFVLAGFNVRVSEDWVVETVDIELTAHHAVIETSLLLSQEREFSGQRRHAGRMAELMQSTELIQIDAN